VVGGAVVDGVSFLDMSVWSVDPFYTSGGEAAYEPENGPEQEQRDDDYYNSIKVPPSPTRTTTVRDDDDNGTRMTSRTTPTFDVPIVLSKTFDETPVAAAKTQETNDEHDDDDCDSTTTVVPRAILQHSMTYDVSVLTMDPTLLTGSPYVEF
jgi:hypothetical protein